MTFQLFGIDPAPYAALFDLDDEALRQLDLRRCIADKDSGYPCRVSLEDARLGEVLLLLSYEHQPARSPYRSAGPVFVRNGATRCMLPPGVITPYVTRRKVSLRAYDAAGMMQDAALCEGPEAGRELERMFSDPAVAQVHLHNATRGCFLCAAQRA